MPSQQPTPRTIQQTDNLDAVRRKVGSYFDEPIAECKITAADEAANKRRITVQVRDRIRQDWAGAWLVQVYLSSTSGGDPSSTGNTVAFVSGTVMEELLADGSWVVKTTDAGVLTFDLTIAGVASRYVSTAVIGRFKESDEITWQ